MDCGLGSGRSRRLSEAAECTDSGVLGLRGGIDEGGFIPTGTSSKSQHVVLA